MSTRNRLRTLIDPLGHGFGRVDLEDDINYLANELRTVSARLANSFELDIDLARLLLDEYRNALAAQPHDAQRTNQEAANLEQVLDSLHRKSRGSQAFSNIARLIELTEAYRDKALPTPPDPAVHTDLTALYNDMCLEWGHLPDIDKI